MSFLTINGTEVYMHQKPPQDLYDLVMTTGRVRLIAGNIALALSVVIMIASLVLAITTDAAGFSIVMLIVLAFAMYFWSKSLRSAYTNPKEFRDAILRGEYRQYFVVPSDFSFDVVFTQTMRKAMAKNRVRSRIDELLGRPEMIEADKEIRVEELFSDSAEFDPGILNIANDLKQLVISSTERLSESQQIKQVDHFRTLREGITQLR